jgi:CRP-like cAMP-binding protein
MRKKNNEICFRVAKELSLEKIRKNKVIINYGDVGIKYYIIVSGRVSVYVPLPPKTFRFDQKEFLKDHEGLIVSVNGKTDFVLPDE